MTTNNEIKGILKDQSSLRIMVVDDHKLFADGLGLVLRSIAKNVEIIIVNNSQSALNELNLNPEFDLLLLDMHMPGLDGLSLLVSIKERKNYIPCVIISATENILMIKQGMDLGAFGFIPKSYDSNQLIDALNLVLIGECFMPIEIMKKIHRLKQSQDSSNEKLDKSLNQTGITKRQHEVLNLLAKGYSNQQIAITLFLSKHTVKSHVAALLSALQAENRTDCVRQGRDYGLIT